jgi:ferredoxin like protein
MHYKTFMEHTYKMKKNTLEEKLYTLKFDSDIYSHLKPDNEICKDCPEKICTTICPAHVYEWNESDNKLIVNFENCLECGACRIACPYRAIDWKYPKGTCGVTFKQS